MKGQKEQKNQWLERRKEKEGKKRKISKRNVN